MALVKFGFTREEIYWMPVTESGDYLKIIKQQQEDDEAVSVEETSPFKDDPKTLTDVYRGPIG